MAEYIEREKVLKELNDIAIDYIKDNSIQCSIASGVVIDIRDNVILKQPTADVVPVVRCGECVHSKRLDKHCELNTDYYLHCKLYRGEEEKNVWHKYKKYFADYSLVAIDDYCSYGERRCDKNEQ